MKLWGKALFLCSAGFFGSFASFYVHDSLVLFFPAHGTSRLVNSAGRAGEAEETAHGKKLNALAQELFETNRQTQILQTELINRFDPSLDIPTLGDLSQVKASAIRDLPSATAAQRESKVLAVDLTLARHQLEKVSEALRRVTTKQNEALPTAAAPSVPPPANPSAPMKTRSAAAAPPVPLPQQTAIATPPAAVQSLGAAAAIAPVQKYAVPAAPRTMAAPPSVTSSPQPMVVPPPQRVPVAPVAPVVPPVVPRPIVPRPIAQTVPPAVPPPQQVPQSRTVNFVGQSLDGASDGTLPETPVDFGCGKQTSGKDKCACQIACAGGKCDNAQAICDKLPQCKTMRTNNSIRKKIATLKSTTTNLFTLPTNLEWWRKEYGQGEKTFFIIGEQKCGTTALYDLLKSHPNVDAPASTRKELHMFDHNHHIDECRLRQYVGLLGSRSGKANLVGEATPDYLADPVAAMMLGRLLPAAKLIVLIRDPIKRAHAAWDQNRRAGSEFRPFKQAVKDEMSTAVRCQKMALQLASGPSTIAQQHAYVETCEMFIDGSPGNCWVNTKYDERPACKRYLYKGFYGAHLRFWLQNFPANQILVIPSEVYFANERVVQAEALQFLGLTPRSMRRRLLGEQQLISGWSLPESNHNSTMQPRGGGERRALETRVHHDGRREEDTRVRGGEGGGSGGDKATYWNSTDGSRSRVARQGRGGRRHLLSGPGGGRGGIRQKQTCWHDCSKAKSKFEDDVSPELHAQLMSFYEPMQAVLEATKSDVRWVLG